jgi:hypothetical protein
LGDKRVLIGGDPEELRSLLKKEKNIEVRIRELE